MKSLKVQSNINASQAHIAKPHESDCNQNLPKSVPVPTHVRTCKTVKAA
ncbi:MAG: hypothetical protein BWX49_01194 [Bacteroidetes bacterium ADurb.Bin008]|nr:MAG: hypothetical protein BWX49_01194 [Bacteroidetes bacterium ADurb.Bin008]